MQTSPVMNRPLSCRHPRLQSHVFGVSQQSIIAAVLGIKHSVDKAYLLALMVCCGEDGRANIRDPEAHVRWHLKGAAEETADVGICFQDIFWSDLMTVSAMCFDNI